MPLESATHLSGLSERPEVQEILDAAQRYPQSRLYLAAYVEPEDVKQLGPSAQDASDRVVVRMARFLADRGIDPERISGKGMGLNESVGRAVVVSIDVAGPPAGAEPSERRLAERAASRQVPDRLPSRNRTFKQVAGTTAYRVGPGDQLRIVYWLAESMRDFTAPVAADGTISFDLVEDASVDGLTTKEIESLLSNILERYYRDLRLDVMVQSYGSRQITIVTPQGGQSATLQGRTTLLDLYTRGGLQPGKGDGLGVPDLSRIRVLRGQREFHANLYEVFVDGDWSENLVLDDGDVVHVPTLAESGRYVFVLGAVSNPGLYPMQRSMTATEAVFAAGGPARGAYLPHARIIRRDGGERKLVPATVNQVVTEGDSTAEQTLRPGDVLFVPSTRIANWNRFLGDISPTLNILTLPLRSAFAFDLFLDDDTTRERTAAENPTPTTFPPP